MPDINQLLRCKINDDVAAEFWQFIDNEIVRSLPSQTSQALNLLKTQYIFQATSHATVKGQQTIMRGKVRFTDRFIMDFCSGELSKWPSLYVNIPTLMNHRSASSSHEMRNQFVSAHSSSEYRVVGNRA